METLGLAVRSRAFATVKVAAVMVAAVKVAAVKVLAVELAAALLNVLQSPVARMEMAIEIVPRQCPEINIFEVPYIC